MAIVIHKFRLNSIGPTTIEVPAEAEVLSAACQDNMATIWVRYDNSQRSVPRIMLVERTGFSCCNLPIKKFVGSVHLDNDMYVAHVFECDTAAAGA